MMGILKYKEYAPGLYYHIYNRGNQRQDIFLSDDDRIAYLERLHTAKKKHNVTILFYCFMPNHIHLVVRQNTEIPIYRFVSSLHTSYSIYFNATHKKVGHLFQDRFKQKIVDRDEYLLYLSAYVHLNPKIDGIVDNVAAYPWSSYLDYIGRRQGVLCDQSLIRSMFQGLSFSTQYEQFVLDILPSIRERKEILSHIQDCP